MKDKKRNPRTYKITDAEYSKAMKRAKKEKLQLAPMIEEVVTAYGDGAFSVSFKSSSKK